MQVIKNDIRQRILSNAKEIFIKNGFQKTSVRDISSRCGVSLGNIYNYFASKDDIFLSVLYPAMISFYRLLDKHHGKNGTEITVINNADYFPQVVNEYFTLIQDHKDLLRLLLFSAQGSMLESFKNDFIKHANSLVRTWFCDMKAKYPHINTDFSDFFLSMHTFWMFEVIEQIIRNNYSEQETIKTLSDYITFEIQGWKQLMGI